MYGMGLRWQFNDWHHPFIPVLMALSRITTNSTSLLLLLQLSAIWLGTFLFAVSLNRQIGAWALLSILLGVTPVVLCQAGYLHKTPLQTALFLLVFGVCYNYHTVKEQPPLFILFLLLFALFIGTPIRNYSYISSIPILMYLSSLFVNGNTLKAVLIKSTLITMSILVLFVIAEKIVVYEVLNAHKRYKAQVIFSYDLAGIMAHSGTIYAKPLLRTKYLKPDGIKKKYEKEDGLYRVLKIFKGINSKEGLKYLFGEWITAIADNPASYLKHRYKAISHCFGIKKGKMAIFRTERTYWQRANRYGLKKEKNALWRLLKKYINFFNQTYWYKPWFWFLLNLLFLTLSTILLNYDRFSYLILPHVVLLSSGASFFFIYLFICLDADLRFVYWGIVSTIFGGFGTTATLINAALKWQLSR
jgi:hypothetical protein